MSKTWFDGNLFLNKKAFVVVFSIFVIVLFFGSYQASAEEGADQPNIVFILVDDLGWEDVGYMGSEFYQTPNIDELAAAGKRFSQAYANSPNCAPTRAALMSGLYAPRTKVYTVAPKDRGKASRRPLLTPENNKHLQGYSVTLAEQFQKAGYATGFFGKWHLGEAGEETGPLAQGFDINRGGYNKGHPKSYFSPYKNPRLEDGPKGEYLTDRLTTEALSFMSGSVKRGKPFFAFLSYYAVHTPIQPKPQVVGKYEKIPYAQRQGRPGYGAMVETLDHNIGRVLRYLKDATLDENTLIVFTSDNGGSGRATTMPSLRGTKGMLYEGGVRIPLAFYWPGKIAPGDVHTPVMSFDHYPTLLKLANIPTPSQTRLDGTDLSALLVSGDSGLSQSALSERPLFWHFPFYLAGSSASGKEFPSPKALTPHGWRAEPGGSVRLGDFKLIEYFDGSLLELYNLKDDLKETNNIAASKPQKTKELHQLLVEWRELTRAHMPPGANPKYRGKAPSRAGIHRQ